MARSLADLSPLRRLQALPSLVESQSRTNTKQILDLLSPLCRVKVVDDFESRNTQSEVVNELLEPVIALYSLARAAEVQFGEGNTLYVLGDENVEWLYERRTDFASSPHGTASASMKQRLEALATLGFIYRFNVARKFGYPEQGVMQMRLNSWGDVLACEWRIEVSIAYRDLVAYLALVFSQFRQEYEELIELCNNAARPLAVKRIHMLNEAVPISVVA